MQLPIKTWQTDSEQATTDVGTALVALLPADSIVSLEGTLGAGKSVLVRGMAMALQIPPEDVTSPTFALWQTYEGSQTLHHLDAYRLNNSDDFLDLGVEELFQARGLVVIEWGDKIALALPHDYFRVTIEVLSDGRREIALQRSVPDRA